MADIEFDPATEFQILETFDFEEEVQRPESLRFYTLDEQLLDYVEKSMPKGKYSFVTQSKPKQNLTKSTFP